MIYREFLKIFIFLKIVSISFSHAEETKNLAKKKGLSCIASDEIIEEIAKKEEYNNKKSQELKIKEKELLDKEKALNEEIKVLDNLKQEIAKSKENVPDFKKEKVDKLIKTFLYMNPKSVSKILAKLENTLAVQVLNEMENERLAKIMNNMSPERSAELSELISGSYKITQKERKIE